MKYTKIVASIARMIDIYYVKLNEDHCIHCHDQTKCRECEKDEEISKIVIEKIQEEIKESIENGKI